MFDIQWTLWGDSVLPAVKELKAEYLGITGNTVEAWMKDDASNFVVGRGATGDGVVVLAGRSPDPRMPAEVAASPAGTLRSGV